MAESVDVSDQTARRIRAFGGPTDEDTIVLALDALDAKQAEAEAIERFWDEADAAAATQRSLPPEEQARIRAAEERLDRATGGR